jgi:hypothetical protein
MSDPEFNQQGEAWEQMKEEFRHDLANLSLLDMIRQMDETQKHKERVETDLKKINARYDVLRLELIPTKMEETGVENIKVEGVGQITLTGDMYVRTLNKGDLAHWLELNNLADLIQPTVNASTLKATIKGRMKKGLPLPDEEVVKVTPFTRASIRHV